LFGEGEVFAFVASEPDFSAFLEFVIGEFAGFFFAEREDLFSQRDFSWNGFERCG
jgi:hypothetical protein